MLSHVHIVPNIAVNDLEKARAFYRDVLGLEETGTDGEWWAEFGPDDGTKLLVYKKPGTKAADSTRATFEVKDIQAEVKDLERRGAHFETVDMPGAKRDGVITSIADSGRMAWLK